MRTPFMKLLLFMFLYFAVIYAIPAPNITILSHNFEHILQWSPGINSPPQTVFNLEQSCSSESPTVSLNIRNTTIDVSKSLEDIYTQCTFFIWASLDNMTSSRAKVSITPYEDTVLGPPTVFLSGCGDCLKISISLPRGSGKKKDLDKFYNSVYFNISWKKAGDTKANQVLTLGEQYVLQNLQPGHKYCIRVVPQTNSNRNTRLSAWQCEYTSKEEPRKKIIQVLPLVSWSLGAAVFAFCMLVLTVSLFYIGCLCKLKILLPKALRNIVQVYYLNPEQTVTERVLLTDVQLSKSKNDSTKNSSLLNLDQESHKEQHEDEDNYCRKVDTEDDEDYDEEDEENSCTYMGCIMNHGALGTNNSEENCIILALPLLDSSGSYHTGHERALHLSVTTLSPHTHSDEKEDKEEVMSEVSGEQNKLSTFRLEPVGNPGGSDATGNVNLFSVTLRALGPEEDQKDSDEEEVCKPLLPKPLVNKVQKEFYRITPLEKPVQTEIKTDDLITKGSQTHYPVCSSDSDIQTNQDTMSECTVTHTGGMHEQNSCLFDETDYCDTDYLTR